MATDWLSVSSSILSAAGAYQQGKLAQGVGQMEAMQHYMNAQRRVRQGNQEAAQYRAAGREAVSNTKVAMVAQGGTVDSEMLSRIKKESELDSIAAMFDGNREAITLKSAGRAAKISGEAKYRAQMLRVGSNLVDAYSTFNKGRKKKEDPQGTGYGKKPKAIPLPDNGD